MAMSLRVLPLLLMCSAVAVAQPLDMSLKAWTPQLLTNIERPTQWTASDDAGLPVIDAHSKAAASGLTRAVDWPGDTRLRWRWQVSRSVKNSQLGVKPGDDFAARIYVLFDPPNDHLSFADRMKLSVGRKLFGDSLPRAAICYVWGAREPVGTMAPNAYTDRVHMIVLDQGDAKAGSWQMHERDLAADYVAAFGHSPAPRIVGLSLMSDTDNTGDEVRARFASIERIATDARRAER